MEIIHLLNNTLITFFFLFFFFFFLFLDLFKSYFVWKNINQLILILMSTNEIILSVTLQIVGQTARYVEFSLLLIPTFSLQPFLSQTILSNVENAHVTRTIKTPC